MAIADEISRLRRLTAEPTTDTYSDADLTAALERNMALDRNGRRQYYADGITVNPYYITTYDVHAAAADIWEEKAALVADEFDYTGDGANMSRSQKHAQYSLQAATCRAKAQCRVIQAVREGFQGREGELEHDRREAISNE